MRLFVSLFCLSSLAYAAQVPCIEQSPIPRRIMVRHADPHLIMALLRGDSPLSPELSAFPEFQGLGPPTANARSLIVGGKLLYNPADNSLWFIPDRN